MPSPTLTRRDLPATLLGAYLNHDRPVAERSAPWRILLVVAHPDDEYYFAAATYRAAQELGAIVDQVVITNGEAGYRYSALAEKVYGGNLTDESAGRSRLPEIRKRETLAAGRILGIRKHYFLDQQDNRFTLDGEEVLKGVWDQAEILGRLTSLLRQSRYDFVFTLLPRESTHGHHKAATLLAQQAVASLPEKIRPVVLGAEPGRSSDPVPYAGLPGFPQTKALIPEPVLVFDRSRSHGSNDILRYEIVVNWVISEHKSQGLFQNDWGKHDVERFWLLGATSRAAQARAAELASALSTANPVRKGGRG